MPEYHVPRTSLHERMKELERSEHEHVVSTTIDPDDRDCYIIVTRSNDAIETRPA
jgi:hypothetical protein